MKNKKLIIVTQLIILVLVVCYLSKIAYQFFISFQEKNKVTDTPNKEYINLFSEKYYSRIHSHNTYMSNVRGNISTFDFDNKYTIVIFKLEAADTLKEPIVDFKNNVPSPVGDVYLDIGQERFDLKYKAGNPGVVSNIFLNLEGDQPTLQVKKENIYSYYLNFFKFSLKYKNEGKPDIYANMNDSQIEKNGSLAANLLFLKKGKFIYVFLMAAKDFQGILEKESIYQLIAR
ncbi:hypothetical protein [Pedobacter sp.]|uniref:hypothetical protein n=1 Tax=Pedobacter sp. TaxID=1411316 RepID=UPI002BE57DA8|nr:hypothetical protein [Pedobacter sp.]HWW37904.1 hypothetical protein [Pedobacter sp.]